jgi:murein tripeptide amidase MpaA
MKFRNSLQLFFIVFLAMTNINAQSESKNVPKDWQTLAEQTDYHKTWSYADTIAYCQKLDKASDKIVYRSIGKSNQGRDIPLVIASEDGAFTPEAARKKGKAVIFIQAGIHPGEIDGKDAGLALLRDAVITKTLPNLLKDVVILYVPIYSVDGHENFNPYMRINQNGPDEMGFRGNANYLNLNRDYMKADAPETRAWLGLWNEWNPDFFIDCHVTDGADFQYNVTYEYAHFQEVSPLLKNWMDEHFDGKVVPKIESEGNILTHYVEFAGREVTGGIATFIATPRFATGYTPLRNRNGLLIETHSLKSYRSRVRGTYDTLRYTIEEIAATKASLLDANKKVDEETVERGKTYDPNRQYPLTLAVTDKSTPLAFKGVEYKIEDSAISGGRMITYGTAPLNITIPRFDEGKVVTSVDPPLYYIVPVEWADVINVLKIHGVKLDTLKKPLTIEVEGYKLTQPKWATASFEGRINVTCKPERIKETRTFPAGSVIVPMAQETADVAIHLLEPAGPDSFVTWGFFNAVFEQKEYGEGYVIEKLAREMLAKDPNLQKEFDERLKDPNFAKNPRARLNFFYEHSPYFLNQKVGIYPVGRILQPFKLP